MQRKIFVVVGVNSEEHAQLIQGDILDAVKERTTIYFVESAKAISKYETVEELGKSIKA